MINRIFSVITVVAAILITNTALADEAKDIEKVRAELSKMVPLAKQAEIVATPAKGVYRATIKNDYVYTYVSGDFVLVGDLLDTKNRVNVGDTAASERMATLLKDVSKDKMIVYGPENPKRYITVFTDIDCGYCRKLHNEIPALTAAGVQVRYLAFPRAGIGSKSYDKYVSVWCNTDQQGSLTNAKSGKTVASATCDNPIEETYKLGKTVGVRGTPTIIFDDGTVTPGYQPSARLIKRLGIKS